MKLRCVSLGWFLTVLLLGGITSAAWASPTAPKAKIITQPASHTVEAGDSVRFVVSLTSGSTARFQWRLNKEPITGATQPFYDIDEVAPSDAGKYDVVVTNSEGEVRSKTATLKVMIAPPSLPVGAGVYGELTYRVFGESETSNGAYVIIGAATMIDPESPGDHYTFTYKRQSATRATFTVWGEQYDAELGGYIAINEIHTLTFTGVSASGERVAVSTGRGTAWPPEGYKPSKVSFSSKGTLSVDLDGSSVSSGSGGMVPSAPSPRDGVSIIAPSS